MGSDGPVKSDRSPIGNAISGIVLAVVVLFTPWLYLVNDRISIASGRFGTFDVYRAAWVVPLYYATGAIGTLLVLSTGLSPSSLASVPISDLVIGALLFQFVIAAVFVSGGSGQFALSGVDFVVFGALLVGGVAAGVTLRRVTGERRARGLLDDGFVLPLAEVYDGRNHDTQHVSLDRNFSTLVMGMTGSGKSTTMSILVRQMQQFRNSDDAPFVILDVKDEFQELFEDDQGRLAQNVVRLSLDGSTDGWNVFCEIRDKQDYEEIGEKIFDPGDEKYDGDKPYFIRAARAVFVAILKYLDDTESDPQNRDLYEFVTQKNHDQIYQTLSTHHDRQVQLAAEDYLDPQFDPSQTKNVVSQLREGVRTVFRDDFAGVGTFSITEYMEDPDGRVLILDMPENAATTSGPAFKFLIDRALDLGIDDPDKHTLYVLDEFPQAPKLDNIGKVTQVGRGYNTQALVALQNYSQLEDRYDEKKASSIVGNMPQQILMQAGPGATETVEHMKRAVGDERNSRLRSRDTRWWELSFTGRKWETITEDVNPFAEADLRRFDPGEAIVILQDGWIHGRISQAKELTEGMRRGLFGEDTGSNAQGLNTESSNRTGLAGQPGSTTSEATPNGSGASSGPDISGGAGTSDGAITLLSKCPDCKGDLGDDRSGDFCPNCGSDLSTYL